MKYNLITFADHFYNAKTGQTNPPHSMEKQEELEWATIVAHFAGPMSRHRAVANKNAVECFAMYKSKTLADDDCDFKVDQQKRKKVRHSEKNVVRYDGVVVDIDGGITIEEFKERFKDWTYVAFTSYSHQTEKKNYTDCFRAIFPVNKPIPKKDWEGLAGNQKVPGPFLTQLFPFADPTSFTHARMFFKPSCPKDTLHLAQRWSNNGGRVVEWEQLEQVKIEERVYEPPVIAKNAVLGGEGRINLATVDMVAFANAHGLKPVKSGNGFHEVNCPWGHEHTDHNIRGAFVKGASFHCKHSHGKKNRDMYTLFGIEAFRPYALVEPEPEPEPERKKRGRPPLVLPQRYATPYNLEKREQMLVKRFGSLTAARTTIYAGEGFGKSKMAGHWARSNVVIFAVESNKHVKEKAEKFAETFPSLRVQAIVGRSYKLQNEYGIQVVVYPELAPWLTSEVNKTETMKRIVDWVEKNERLSGDQLSKRADEIWQKTAPDRPSFKNNIIVCTHDRALAWEKQHQSAVVRARESDEEELRNKQKKRISRIEKKLQAVIESDEKDPQIGKLKGTLRSVKKMYALSAMLGGSPENDCVEYETSDGKLPKNTIIMYDDTQNSDWWRLHGYEKGYQRYNEEGEKILEEAKVGHKLYYVKPLDEMYGFGAGDYNVVFTTTESITRTLIANTYKDHYCPEDLFPSDPIDAGDITLISTPIVRKKSDGILPCIMERVKKSHPNTYYVADGQNAEFNHVTVKGRNDMMSGNVVIELSQANYKVGAHLEDEFEFRGVDAKHNDVIFSIARDQFHQAVGRNQGYRESGYQCVVLADPQLAVKLYNQSRYYIPKEKFIKLTENVLEEKYREAINGKAATISEALCALIANVDHYVGEQGLLEDDLSAAVEGLDNDVIKQVKRRVIKWIEDRIRSLSGEAKS